MRSNIVRFHISQVNDAVGNGILTFVQNQAVDGTQLRAITFTLWMGWDSGKSNDDKNKRYRRCNLSGSHGDLPQFNLSGNERLNTALKILDVAAAPKRCK